jgi:hypothetical protein
MKRRLIEFLIRHWLPGYSLFDAKVYRLVIRPVDEVVIRDLIKGNLPGHHLSRNPVRVKKTEGGENGNTSKSV